MKNRKNRGSLIFGLAFIILAINMLLSQLKIVDISIFTIVVSLVCITYGLYSLFSKNFTIGTLGILFGLKYSATYYKEIIDFTQVGYFTLLFIALLLGLGLELLFGGSRKRKHFTVENDLDFSSRKSSSTYYDGDFNGEHEYLSFKTTFSEDTRYIYTHALKEADFDVNMGSMSVFFQERDLQQDLTLNLYCKMGNLEVYLPREWRIVDNLNVTLGNVDIDNYNANPTSLYTVTLKGNSVLGNIEIHYI